MACVLLLHSLSAPATHAGYYSNGPPVMAPPQYQYAAPPRREPSFLEGW